VVPARPHKPKDKALVEAAVYVVYTRVIAPLRNRKFETLDELNTAIWEKLDILNDRKMKKFDISRRERFEQIEKPLLAPLPSRPYKIRYFIPPTTVQKNYHVYFKPDGHYYSVPYRFRKKKVRIAYTADEVEIYSNNSRIAAHRRERKKNGYTTTYDHMPSQHQIVSEWNPQRLLNWASKYGSETKKLISRVIDSREVPEQAYKSCLGILNLSKKFGGERLEAASARANYFAIYSTKGLKNILEKGLERQDLQRPQQPELPSHENIRGHSYYESGEEEVRR
jgi:transposase